MWNMGWLILAWGMDLSLIYRLYTVHTYIYTVGWIYSESKQSLFYIAGKNKLPLLVLIDRPMREDNKTSE